MPMALRTPKKAAIAAPKPKIAKKKSVSAAKRRAAQGKAPVARKVKKSVSATKIKGREGTLTKAHLQLVKDLPTGTIESLSTTLKHIPASRPALRAKVQGQIARAGEKRGSYTRGWAGRAPQKGNERKLLYKECGSEAFLLPNHENPGQSKFPIVARFVKGQKNCEAECGGIQAALIRARQHKYEKVAQTAVHLLEEKCPDSARARAKHSSAAKKSKSASKMPARGKGKSMAA